MAVDIRLIRAFVFSNSDDLEFDTTVQERMAEDGVRSYLHFLAMSDTSPDYNVFAVLDCNSKGQARRLARRYFGSVIAFGELQGRLGLKNM